MELKPLQVKIIQRLSKTNKSEELRNKLRSWIVTNEVSVTDLLYNIDQKNVIVSSSILNKLGLLYGQGKEGLVENPETAFLFYLTSAKLGNASANGNVAQYYYDGRAIGGQNLELAYQFCLKSLLLGSDKNMLMGEILFESENYVEAIKYLRKILDTNTESKSFEKQRLRSEARELEKSCLFQLLNSTFPEINLGLVDLNSSSYEQNSSFLSSPSTPIAVPASDTPKRPQLALSLLANSLSKNLQINTDNSTSGATDGTVNNSKYNNNISKPNNRTASPSNLRLSSTKNINSSNGNGNQSTSANSQTLLLTPTSTKTKTAQNNSNNESGVFVFVNHKTNDTSNNRNNNSNITPRGSITPRNNSNNNNNNNNSNNNNSSNNNINSSNSNNSTMVRLASPMRHNLSTTVDASVFVKKLLTHECPGWFYVTDNLDGFDQNSCMELTAKAKILELECVAIKSAYESAEAHIELARKNNFSKEIIKILVSTKVSEFEEVYRKLEQNKVTLLAAWNKYIDTDEHTLRRQIHMENLFFSPAHTANYHTYNLAKHLLARRVYDGTVDVRSSYGASDAYVSSDLFGVSTYLSNGNENNGAEPIYLNKFSAQNSNNSGNSGGDSTIPNAKVLITAERALLETAIVAYGRANNSVAAVQKTGWTPYTSEANNTNSNTVKTPKTPTNISYNGITNSTADVSNSNSKSVTHNISYNHTNVQNNNTNNNSNINYSGKPSMPISPTRAVFNVTHVNRPLSPTRTQQNSVSGSTTTTPTNKNNRNDVSLNTTYNSSNATNELNTRQNDVDLVTTANNSINNINNNGSTTIVNSENDERSFIITEYTHPETIVLGETILKYKHNTTTVLTMNNNSNNNDVDKNNSDLPVDFIILNEPVLENSSTVLAFIYKLLNIPLFFYTMNAKNSAQLSADREQYVLLESHLATLIHTFVSKGQLITLQSLSTLNEDISESDVHTLNKVIYTVFVKHIVKYVVSGGQNRNNNKGNINNININSNRSNSQNVSPVRTNNSNNNINSSNNNNSNSNNNTNNLTNSSTQRVATNTTTNANLSDTQLPLATAVSRALSLIKLGVLTFYELFNSNSEYSVLSGFGYSGVSDSNNSVAGTQQQLTLREKIINVNHLYNKAIMENSNADQYRDIVQFWKQHGNSGLMIPTYKALCEELATTYGSGVNDTVSYLEPLHVIADFQDFELENLLKKIEI